MGLKLKLKQITEEIRQAEKEKNQVKLKRLQAKFVEVTQELKV